MQQQAARTRRLRILATATAVTACVSGAFVAGVVTAQAAKPKPASITLQTEFDHIGAEVHSLNHGGRDLYYVDEGQPGQRAVVFIGGQGTSLEAFQLSEFARTSREKLGLRVISVERNGFGESPLDLTLGYADYTAEVLAVLDHLGIDRFVTVAISGGGAYAAHLAAAVPDRVISLHAAAASDATLPNRNPRNCTLTFEQRNASNQYWYEHAKAWWGVPGSPVLAIPGWQSTAYLDAVRSFHLGDGPVDPSPLSHEGELPCLSGAIVDPAQITSPTYLYWGGADTTVPASVMENWQEALPNVVRTTVYPGEGHTVQYRHWDQILLDMAGHSDQTVVCKSGQTKTFPNAEVPALIAGGATLGLCAWTP
ncbi:MULTISPECIES: alpha/beta fold hydrolase [unclassified Nocardioides]|uniref:alpha/beta fold hydrolase n=1 Tax=unclassified Nocardioides TaxID=2615069 RepID=UPI0009EA1CE6|nr:MULTISPECIES: alpha/beta hydrolase [unclassified Nocardioides]